MCIRDRYTPAFYAKYMQDALEEQIHLYNGSVPHAVPMMIEDTSEFGSHGAAAWADMAIIIPWTMYVFYGDKALLQKQYANMQAWAEYLLKEDAEDVYKRQVLESPMRKTFFPRKSSSIWERLERIPFPI